jgi:hypothetical protein
MDLGLSAVGQVTHFVREKAKLKEQSLLASLAFCEPPVRSGENALCGFDSIYCTSTGKTSKTAGGGEREAAKRDSLGESNPAANGV